MAGRINPTIFDKLAASQSGREARPADAAAAAPPREVVGQSVIPGIDGFKQGILRVDLERFGESALRANVRRELGWLLNTTNLESAADLSACPRVRTSVLNYGVADLAGKAQSRLAIAGRAARIREAIRAFEPRLDDKKLAVEAVSTSDRENAITFVITGDITSAVESLRVQYYTDVETDTGNADIRE
ncbi:MAG TPA: type VI secretion system baseplate subunit TssE [Rhizomicrobium sp.]